MVRRVLAAAVTLIFMGSPLALAVPTPGPTPEQRLVGGVNRVRERREIPSVGTHLVLSSRAERHVRDMISSGELFHSDLERTCRDLRDPYVCGEVVGVGDRAHSLIRALMGSPPHRQILLDPRYDRGGAGGRGEGGGGGGRGGGVGG